MNFPVVHSLFERWVQKPAPARDQTNYSEAKLALHDAIAYVGIPECLAIMADLADERATLARLGYGEQWANLATVCRQALGLQFENELYQATLRRIAELANPSREASASIDCLRLNNRTIVRAINAVLAETVGR